METRPSHENTAGSSEESSLFVKSFEKTRTPRTLYAEASQKPLAMTAVKCLVEAIVDFLLGSWDGSMVVSRLTKRASVGKRPPDHGKIIAQSRFMSTTCHPRAAASSRPRARRPMDDVRS